MGRVVERKSLFRCFREERDGTRIKNLTTVTHSQRR